MQPLETQNIKYIISLWIWLRLYCVRSQAWEENVIVLRFIDAVYVGRRYVCCTEAEPNNYWENLQNIQSPLLSKYSISFDLVRFSFSVNNNTNVHVDIN